MNQREVRRLLNETVKDAAIRHCDIADPKELAELLKDDVKGLESEIVEILFPRYVADILRRKDVKAAKETAWESLMNERLYTADDGYIFVQDANSEQMDAAADRRKKFAGNLDHRAKVFQSVSDEMKLTGINVAGNLEPKRGEQIIWTLEQELKFEKSGLSSDRKKVNTLKSLQQTVSMLEGWIENPETHPLVTQLQAKKQSLWDEVIMLEAEVDRVERLDEILEELVAEHG